MIIAVLQFFLGTGFRVLAMVIVPILRCYASTRSYVGDNYADTLGDQLSDLAGNYALLFK
jgi:hypothetical protein